MKFMYFFYPALAATLSDQEYVPLGQVKQMLIRFGKEILPHYV